MFSSFLISFFVLIGLLVLHELSHFLTAKHFKIPVEEFGIGYPPRIFGYKWKDTVYSLNLLPFGAFVRIDEEVMARRSFSQRAKVILAGIIFFWFIAFVLIAGTMIIGLPQQISDEEQDPSAFVQILAVSSHSPGEEAGLEEGDIVLKVKTAEKEIRINKVKELQEISAQNENKEMTLFIRRGEKILEKKVIPQSLDGKEARIGIIISRVAIKKYPFYLAPFKAAEVVFLLTLRVVGNLFQLFFRLVRGQKVEGEMMGPVGIFSLFVKAKGLGWSYFLSTVSVICLNVAVFNAIPIPVTDGGRFLFLLVEKIRKKPIKRETEEKIIGFFFLLLIFLAFLVTIKDIKRLP